MRFVKVLVAASAVLFATGALATDDAPTVVKRIVLTPPKAEKLDVRLPRGTTATGITFKGAGAYCADLRINFAHGKPSDVLYQVDVPTDFHEVYHFADNGEPSVTRNVHVECYTTGGRAVTLTISAGQ